MRNRDLTIDCPYYHGSGAPAQCELVFLVSIPVSLAYLQYPDAKVSFVCLIGSRLQAAGVMQTRARDAPIKPIKYSLARHNSTTVYRSTLL
jgi:hypothetical protein